MNPQWMWWRRPMMPSFRDATRTQRTNREHRNILRQWGARLHCNRPHAILSGDKTIASYRGSELKRNSACRMITVRSRWAMRRFVVYLLLFPLLLLQLFNSEVGLGWSTRNNSRNILRMVCLCSKLSRVGNDKYSIIS